MRFFCIPFACNPQVDSIDKRQCNLQAIPVTDLERYSRSLEELLLDMNHLKDLPKALFRLQKLRRLGLSDNDIHRLPPDVGALQSLVDLNISRNDISDIPDELKSCRQLLLLDISSNPIARLPDSITLITTLTHLAINDTSLTRLPPDIGRLAGLRSLEVRENHLRNLPSTITNFLLKLVPLRGLVELYLDENSLETLPDSILNCKALEQLDISSNRLSDLPDQFGELDRITDLTLSHNCLDSLPNSIGRLKRMTILKADDNNLTRLTPAIGSCTALTELFLMQNFLSEIPSSIGNLNNLVNLNLDKNQAPAIPPLIGNCTSLTVLSIRDNQLEELPLEIGKLSRLRVLDVANNRLAHLPYTINVLQNLQALWLSENQSQAMVKLVQNTDPKTNIRVLTCYLLPQQSANLQDAVNNKAPSSKNTEFVGGPKVHFGDSETPEAEENQKLIGNFERKATPHPKPAVQSSKLKKQLVDGHVIQHEDDRRPSVVSLTKKSSTTEIPETLNQRPQHTGPKSSLKHPPVYNTPNSEDSSFISSGPAQAQKEERSVGFKLPNINNNVSPDVESTEHRLKRINTPNYKRQRIAIAQQQQRDQQSPMSNVQRLSQGQLQESRASTSEHAKDNSSNFSGVKRVIIRREPNVGLGLSIAGGVESTTTFIENDNGLFISKLTSGGPADRAGLRVGDKILEVNGTSMVEQRHAVAVKCMQENNTAVELVIQRGLGGSSVSIAQPKEPNHLPSAEPPKQGPFVVTTTEQKTPTLETISTTIMRTQGQPLGMSMLHTNEINPNKSPLRIQYIAPDGLVKRDGKLRVGDEVLSINGINLKGMRFDDALGLLQNASVDGHNNELHLVVQRVNDPKLQKTELFAGDLPYGDHSVDGVVEMVELSRDVNASLGLSVVGGVDHACHPFAVDQPGVFISKITPNSPASRCRKLRVGDRILNVNGHDISKAKHAEAVDLLKSSGQILKLKVCHDAQPKGLQEVFIKRRPGQPLGLTIVGGIGGSPANAADPTDEGIFIVEANNSAAEVSALRLGTRILEVNDESLLGCTKSEAANILRKSTGTVRLLVCEGFVPDLANKDDDLQTAFSLGSSSMTLPSFSASASTLPQLNNPSANQSANELNFTPTFIPSQPPTITAKTTPTVFDNTVPLARSSPVPQSKPAPPPRATTELSTHSISGPPPLSSPTSVTTFSASKSAEPKTSVESGVEPENLTFNSKIRHFENELNLRKSFTEKLSDRNQLGNSPYASNKDTNVDKHVGQKLPLVTDQDLKQIKENLVKTGDHSTTALIENRPIQTRNIPIKIQTHNGEQNGKSWRDSQITNLHNEAFRIDTLNDYQRPSIKNGNNNPLHSEFKYQSGGQAFGLKSQDTNLTGILQPNASFEFADADK
ncbi:Protein lap1 [Aphelenchoides bicaudatus]|nr:Protein lap1 [Aphelenchoides bicaudatus]